MGREDEATQKQPPSPFHNVVIPKDPRSNIPQRNPNFFNGQRQRRMHQGGYNLPPGWFTATDPRGNIYYYNKNGETTWARPSPLSMVNKAAAASAAASFAWAFTGMSASEGTKTGPRCRPWYSAE